jgi:hypothetical protein
VSNEISYNFQILLSNVSLKDQYASGSVAATQTTAALIRNVISAPALPTLHVALDLGSIATPGFAVFQNLDLVNYVEIGIDVSAAFYPFLKLKPGEQGMLRLGTTAPYAQANTLAVSLFYIIYSD